MTEEPGRTVKEVPRNLGVAQDLLYPWRSEFRSKDESVFPGRGKEALTDQEKRIRKLEKKLNAHSLIISISTITDRGNIQQMDTRLLLYANRNGGNREK